MKCGFRAACVAHGVLVALALSVVGPAMAGTETYLDGYFRLRARMFDNLTLNRGTLSGDDPSQVTPDSATTYVQQRLLASPELRVNQYLSIHAQFDVLPNLLWGTQPERLAGLNDYYEPMGFSQSFSEPGTVSVINTRRVWAEVYTPIGRVKVGRTGMEVGSGLYFNEGNGIDDDYGDTVDRIQYLTRVGDIWLLLGYDMIYEGLVDGSDDAQSSATAAAIAYRSELASGSFYTYLQNDRYRPDESTVEGLDDEPLPDDLRMLTWTFDLWGEAKVGPIDVELEAILRYGKGSVVLNPVEGEEVVLLEGASLFQYGGMARANWTRGPLNLGLEFGLASGDANPNDGSFTGFTFDRDYHIGFLMFRVPLPTVTTANTAESVDGTFEDAVVGNAVTNAWYLMPSLGTRFFGKWNARLSGVGAFTLVPTEDLNLQKDYGYELDLDIQTQLFDKLTVGARGALLLPGAVFGDNRDFAFGGELSAAVTF